MMRTIVLIIALAMLSTSSAPAQPQTEQARGLDPAAR
jgi:hypothetical protein